MLKMIKSLRNAKKKYHNSSRLEVKAHYHVLDKVHDYL